MPTTKVKLSDFAADLNLPVQEVIDRLEGIRCGGKPSSCPDQIARALKAWQAQHA